MRPKWSKKKTYGVNLNPVNPGDQELIAALERAGNQSGFIREALRVYLNGGGDEPPITEHELRDLRARIAWLEQNHAAPVSTETPSPTSAQPVAAAGRELSEGFKAAIIKAARPGIRLEN